MTQKKGQVSRTKTKATKKARTKKDKASQVDKSTDPFETEIGPDVIVGAGASEESTTKSTRFQESFEASSAADSQASGEGMSDQDSDQEAQVNRIEFPYSEMVRAYAPNTMKVMDRVVTDWKHEGNFMNLGIENPYANMAVSLGLQKAKEVEKKLDERGVLSAVRMGLEVLKQQVNKKK